MSNVTCPLTDRKQKPLHHGGHNQQKQGYSQMMTLLQNYVNKSNLI